MSDSSRYVHYSSSRLPRLKRTLPLYGEKEDAGKWYRCWNCGWRCNSDRDMIGTGSGVTILDAPEINTGTFGTGSTVAVLDDHYTALENGADDLPITNYEHNQYPTSTSGCPFCGSRNWK